MTSEQTIYNVHIYREMRLYFPGIKALSPGAAAEIAREKATDEAENIEDCDGESIAALVDVEGDAEYMQSRVVDFTRAQLQKAARDLLAAAVLAEEVLSDLARLDDGTPSVSALNLLRAAINQTTNQ